VAVVNVDGFPAVLAREVDHFNTAILLLSRLAAMVPGLSFIQRNRSGPYVAV